MIRILQTLSFSGYIFDNPIWRLKQGMKEIHFHFIPDPEIGTSYLDDEMAQISVIVKKRTLLSDDLFRYQKKNRIELSGLLCSDETGQEPSESFDSKFLMIL